MKDVFVRFGDLLVVEGCGLTGGVGVGGWRIRLSNDRTCACNRSFRCHGHVRGCGV